MEMFAYRRRRKDFRSVVQALQNHGTPVSGPYRRRNGTLVFSVADCVITEDELLELPCDRRLESNDIQQLLAEIGKRPT
jgi:hypothetical protein